MLSPPSNPLVQRSARSDSKAECVRNNVCLGISDEKKEINTDELVPR
jgi:hypothetical protein